LFEKFNHLIFFINTKFMWSIKKFLEGIKKT